MASKLATVWLICSAMCLPTYAYAGDSVPDQVGAFVAYCPSHFADCKDAITTYDISVLAGILFANSGEQRCIVPRGMDMDVATQQILAWLGKHKETDAMKTSDGVRAAEKDIWHCAAQVGDGTLPGDPPAKTGEFVAYCDTHYAKCADELVAVSVEVMIPDPPEHCSPPSHTTTKAMYDAVLPWLKQHPETYGLNTDDGVMAAFDGLWPCH